MLHFIAHILEFAILTFLVVVVVRLHLVQSERIRLQDIRLIEYNQHFEISKEQVRLYGEWLKRVRTKEGFIDGSTADSLAKSTERKTP